MLRKEEVIKKLKEDQGTRSLREYAPMLGYSASYLNDVYSGRREPSSKLLDHLNLERVQIITYVTKRRWK